MPSFFCAWKRNRKRCFQKILLTFLGYSLFFRALSGKNRPISETSGGWLGFQQSTPKTFGTLFVGLVPSDGKKYTMKDAIRRQMLAFADAAIQDAEDRQEVHALFRPKRDRLLTGREAAELAQITRRTLRNWEKRGWVKSVHVTPRRVRFSLAALQQFLGETVEA